MIHGLSQDSQNVSQLSELEVLLGYSIHHNNKSKMSNHLSPYLFNFWISLRFSTVRLEKRRDGEPRF